MHNSSCPDPPKLGHVLLRVRLATAVAAVAAIRFRTMHSTRVLASMHCTPMPWPLPGNIGYCPANVYGDDLAFLLSIWITMFCATTSTTPRFVSSHHLYSKLYATFYVSLGEALSRERERRDWPTACGEAMHEPRGASYQSRTAVGGGSSFYYFLRGK